MKREFLFLFLLLSLAFAINFHPHSGYEYPVHVDEWEFFIDARIISESESTVCENPRPFETEFSGMEILTGTLIAVLNKAGIDWLLIFRYAPAFLSVLFVSSVYILARRQGFGLEAGLFAALIPTSIRLLGPGFLVAVSIGLPVLVLSMFIVFYKKSFKIPLLIFSVFLLFLHPPTAMALFIFLVINSVLNLKSRKRFSLALLAVIALSLLFYLPYSLPYLQGRGAESLTFETTAPILSIINLIGLPAIIFFSLGTYFISSKPGKKNLSLVFFTIAIFIIVVVFRYFDYTLILMPTRAHMYLMVLISVIAGYGLKTIRKNKYVFVLSVALIILFGSFNALGQRYYHLIDDQDYRAFRWVEKNTPENATAVLDPVKAVAFFPVSGRKFYSYVPRSYNELYGRRNYEVQKFLKNSCGDDGFLEENGITLVYTEGKCVNSRLKSPYKNVYVYYQ